MGRPSKSFNNAALLNQEIFPVHSPPQDENHNQERAGGDSQQRGGGAWQSHKLQQVETSQGHRQELAKLKDCNASSSAGFKQVHINIERDLAKPDRSRRYSATTAPTGPRSPYFLMASYEADRGGQETGDKRPQKVVNIHSCSFHSCNH